MSQDQLAMQFECVRMIGQLEAWVSPCEPDLVILLVAMPGIDPQRASLFRRVMLKAGSDIVSKKMPMSAAETPRRASWPRHR
jgi:hypothetical protein